MSMLGKYVKAYLAKQFREFPGWTENTQSLRTERKEVDGNEVETKRTQINDDDILYLQENFVVTDDIFLDRHIVFDNVTEEWKEFCRNNLNFQIPVYESSQPAQAQGS